MKLEILRSEDPGFVLSRAGVFLSSQPVLHNLVLSLLHARVAHREAGHYWMAIQKDDVLGVAIRSPVTFPAVLTPMEMPVAMAMADAIWQAGVALPGVNADAATAATFAGQWSERSKSAATPFQGLRLYELTGIAEAPSVEGALRQASVKDRSLMIDWIGAFQREIHESDDDTEVRTDRWLAEEALWIWERQGEAVSMAVSRGPVHDVMRLSGVYTPPEKRKHGYAEACVHALSKRLGDASYRCILYTDLGNPTSNSIYRRIGYRAVLEGLRYRFDRGGI